MDDTDILHFLIQKKVSRIQRGLINCTAPNIKISKPVWLNNNPQNQSNMNVIPQKPHNLNINYLLCCSKLEQVVMKLAPILSANALPSVIRFCEFSFEKNALAPPLSVTAKILTGMPGTAPSCWVNVLKCIYIDIRFFVWLTSFSK